MMDPTIKKRKEKVLSFRTGFWERANEQMIPQGGDKRHQIQVVIFRRKRKKKSVVSSKAATTHRKGARVQQR